MDETIKELTLALSDCQNEILALKKQNQTYEQMLQAMKESLHVFMDSFSEIINTCDALTQKSNEHAVQLSNLDFHAQYFLQCISNMKYELFDPNINLESLFYPHILDASVAIDEIIQNRKSLARFGDGEFAIMMKVERQKFQRIDDKLSRRLYETLHSTHPDLLVAIANNYGSLDQYNAQGALGIRLYMTDEVRAAHKMLLEPDRVYYDAYLSRPYALYKDNYTDAPRKRFDHLKQIWQDRDVIFVEGSLTRLGVGNDLFDNAKSIRRIIAPPTSSFDRYDDILAASLEYAEADTLFLLAIGPCAGVLANDLCQNGYQAVDIGHVDLEYEWFLQGKGGRCSVPTKYNNEFIGGDEVSDLDDPLYNSQILCSFS